VDQLRKERKELRKQLDHSESEKRRLQGKLVGPQASKGHETLVQLQTEASVLKRKLIRIKRQRDAALVTKATLEAKVGGGGGLLARGWVGARSICYVPHCSPLQQIMLLAVVLGILTCTHTHTHTHTHTAFFAHTAGGAGNAGLEGRARRSTDVCPADPAGGAVPRHRRECGR